MKTIVENTFVVVLARVVVGIVFIYASVDKLGDPVPFAHSIGNYKIFSEQIGMITATVLPWLELLCGVSLLLGVLVKGSSLTTSILLLLFTAIVISALARSLDISCGCFTQDPTAQKLGWWKVFENTGLCLLSLVIFISHNTHLQVDSLMHKKTGQMP